MELSEIKIKLVKHLSYLRKKYYVQNIGIFGSYVRNEQKNTSDIDILVIFSNPISLFDFIDLEDELSELLQIKVDLVSKSALKPFIGKHILKEVEML